MSAHVALSCLVVNMDKIINSVQFLPRTTLFQILGQILSPPIPLFIELKFWKFGVSISVDLRF